MFGGKKKGETAVRGGSSSGAGASGSPSARKAGGEREQRPERPTSARVAEASSRPARVGSAAASDGESRASVGPAAWTLGPQLSFEGKLTFSGSVVVDCEFRGSIVSDDTLVVGPSAVVEAEVCAGVVEIAGKVKGDVKGKTSVRILSGGELRGNIETPTVSIEEGVVFEGSCCRPGTSGAGESAQPQRTSSAVSSAAAPAGSHVAGSARTFTGTSV